MFGSKIQPQNVLNDYNYQKNKEIVGDRVTSCKMALITLKNFSALLLKILFLRFDECFLSSRPLGVNKALCFRGRLKKDFDR